MKSNKLGRWLKTVNYPSYFVFFVTAFCNARCKMCFYQGSMEQNRGAEKELSLDEYEKISKSIKLINILGISGGEPFLRKDLSEIIRILYSRCQPLVVDLPTNGFYTDDTIKQVEAIARQCPKMIVDVQLSIDGPPEVHNEIRGVDGWIHADQGNLPPVDSPEKKVSQPADQGLHRLLFLQPEPHRRSVAYL